MAGASGREGAASATTLPADGYASAGGWDGVMYSGVWRDTDYSSLGGSVKKTTQVES